MRSRLLVVLALLTVPGLLGAVAALQEADSSLPRQVETNLLRQLEGLELARTDEADAVTGARWTLRSGHFVFGMPRLADDRNNFTPDGFDNAQAGITVVAREGLVVANFDRMKVPLWVAQRWTRFDNTRMNEVAGQGRPWREDLELPAYARGGTRYDGNRTLLDRGHMARHQMNRAWGIDTSNWGVKMSNSAPQHRDVNQGNAWRELEDEVRDVVVRQGSGIDAVWTITGTIYRDENNPAGESPEDDFQNVVRITDGFGVPDATYKVVGWFDASGRFQARGYVFEQPHTEQQVGGQQQLTYTIPVQTQAQDFIVRIRDIEDRTGVDFFPMLRDNIENLIEEATPSNLWGAQ